MDTPTQDIEAIHRLLGDAQQAAEEARWEDARRALEQAIAIDPLQPKPVAQLADVMERLHDPGKAGDLRSRAKSLRQQQWQRQVEAEARGRHELTGEAAHREIP
jgi:uncharacterized protein HemY